jgi:hypothetical protein
LLDLADRRGRQVGQQLRQVSLWIDAVPAATAGQARPPSPPQFHQLNQRCWRRHSAPDAELDEFGHIDPPAS